MAPATHRPLSNPRLEVAFACPDAACGASALAAAREAASSSGFAVIESAAGEEAALLLRRPRSLMYGLCGALASRRPPASEAWLDVELRPANGGTSLALVVSAPKSQSAGRFLKALRRNLSELAARALQAPALGEDQAHYLVHRALADPQRRPGAAMTVVAEGLDDLFARNVGSAEVMTYCIEGVERVCETLVLELEASLRPWLRASVERSVFALAGRRLWALYADRNDLLDQRFVQRATASKEALPEEAQLLAALGVRQDFLATGAPDDLHSRSDGSSLASAPTTATTASSPASAPSRGVSAPAAGGSYAAATLALNSVEAILERGGSPRHALEMLRRAQLEMKVAAFDISGGRRELEQADDVLPLFIFVVVRSGLCRPVACAELLDDFLAACGEVPCRGSADLEAAARYIADDDSLTEVAESNAT